MLRPKAFGPFWGWVADIAFRRAIWRNQFVGGPGGVMMMLVKRALSNILPSAIFDSIVRTNDLASIWLDAPRSTRRILRPIAFLSGYIMGVTESAIILAEDALGGIE